MNDGKTHTEKKTPQISLNRLADYMAASEQGKRGILVSCKYQSKARVIQHNDAKALISNYLRSGNNNVEDLKHKLEILKSKICDTVFDEEQNKFNCDYVARFISVLDEVDLPDAELHRPPKSQAIILGDTKVTFTPNLLVTRTTKTNKIRLGSICLRYAKGKSLNSEIAAYQSAFQFSFLSQYPFQAEAQADKALCLTLDAYAPATYEAPGNSGYLYKEMVAACTGIAERWDKIKPPKNAVL